MKLTSLDVPENIKFQHKNTELILRDGHRLRVCDNLVLQTVFGPKSEVATGGNCTMSSFMTCTPHHMLFAWSRRIR